VTIAYDIAGDIAGAVQLNVGSWLGPEASPRVREQVREMQQHAFDVQLAGGEVEEIETETDLSAVRAPCLAISGGHDFPDFRQIAAAVPGLSPVTSNSPGRATCPAWSALPRSPRCCSASWPSRSARQAPPDHELDCFVHVGRDDSFAGMGCGPYTQQLIHETLSYICHTGEIDFHSVKI